MRNHVAGARRSWFHLYGLLVLGNSVDQALQQQQEREADEAQEQGQGQQREQERRYRHVVSALEAFVQTSTVGEYEARLQLLGSFRVHLTLVAGTAASAAALPPHLAADIAAALANTQRYYAQFVPAVRSAIEAGLTPLEKDLQGFVALAKWEDRGFYALKASAEKAQRYLHR